jgi:Homeodomain-like domain-containing protein
LIDLSPDLQRRVDQIIAKLAVLSDAPTGMAHDRRASPALRAKAEMLPGKTWADHERQGHPSFDSKEPPGVKDRRSKTPSADFDSLTEWFAHRLENARSEVEVRMLCREAELRCERARGVGPRPVASDTRELERWAKEQAKERRKRTAAGYPGLSPEEVELIESEHELGFCPADSVRVDRFREGYDPETGLPLPEERKLKGAERKLRARELYADGDGLSIREIARRFGVHMETVREWLGRRGSEAA